MSTEGRIYLETLAGELGRAGHTIRQWLKRDDFPRHLRPGTEGGRNKLFWTTEQLPGLREYAAERASNRGFGRLTSTT